MFPRRSLAFAGLALGLVVGCGPVIRSSWKIQRGMTKVESALTPNKLDYTVYLPSHRVALSTSEALKAELPEVKISRVELTRDKNFDTPEGKTPEPGSVVIPNDYPACWFDGLSGSKAPILINCRLVEFEGKTKDGQKVEVLVQLDLTGSDQRTVVSVRVGGRGDASGSERLIDSISARVQNPSTRPGSPEERDALKAAFDLGPKADLAFSEASGEVTIKAR